MICRQTERATASGMLPRGMLSSWATRCLRCHYKWHKDFVMHSLNAEMLSFYL